MNLIKLNYTSKVDKIDKEITVRTFLFTMYIVLKENMTMLPNKSN